MSTYKLIIFDLDGTLIDSKVDIATSINLTLEDLEHPTLDLDLICSHVGYGISYLLQNCLPEEAYSDIPDAKKIFLAHYEKHICDATTLYPGIKEGLNKLSSLNKAILTNKPSKLSVLCLKSLGIISHFPQIIGGDTLEFRKPNPIGINMLATYYNIEKSSIAMVGDSKVDIETGKNADIITLALDWGYASRDNLKEANPDIIFSNFADIVTWIENN